MSRRRRGPRPEGETRVRIYCDHGEKSPRVDTAIRDGDGWRLFRAGELGEQHTSLTCHSCRRRVVATASRLTAFLDIIVDAGIHSVSLAQMGPRLAKVGGPETRE